MHLLFGSNKNYLQYSSTITAFITGTWYLYLVLVFVGLLANKSTTCCQDNFCWIQKADACFFRFDLLSG